MNPCSKTNMAMVRYTEPQDVERFLYTFVKNQPEIIPEVEIEKPVDERLKLLLLWTKKSSLPTIYPEDISSYGKNNGTIERNIKLLSDEQDERDRFSLISKACEVALSAIPHIIEEKKRCETLQTGSPSPATCMISSAWVSSLALTNHFCNMDETKK